MTCTATSQGAAHRPNCNRKAPNVSPDDHEEDRETARQIEQQQPGWIVLYGVYSHQYVAFPLFGAPAGTILTAAYPPAMVQRIQATEHQLRRKGPADHDRQAAQDPGGPR